MTVKLNRNISKLTVGGLILCWGTDIFCSLDSGNYRWYSFLMKNKLLFLFQIIPEMQNVYFSWLSWFRFSFPCFLSFLLILKVCSLWATQISPLSYLLAISDFPQILTLHYYHQFILNIIKFYLLPLQRWRHWQNMIDSKYRPPRKKKGRPGKDWWEGKKRSWRGLHLPRASTIFHTHKKKTG